MGQWATASQVRMRESNGRTRAFCQMPITKGYIACSVKGVTASYIDFHSGILYTAVV